MVEYIDFSRSQQEQMHEHTDERSGVILAGGYSTRFGNRDKVFAELAGEPLLVHVLRRLNPIVDHVLVSCRTSQINRIKTTVRDVDLDLSIRTVTDPVVDAGPAAGLASALDNASSYTIAVASDNPLLDPNLLSFLRQRATGHDGAIPRFDDQLRPTQAVYRAKPMRVACQRTLTEGDGSLRDAVDRLDVRIVSEELIRSRFSPKSFIDVNTPADLDEARSALRRNSSHR